MVSIYKKLFNHFCSSIFLFNRKALSIIIILFFSFSAGFCGNIIKKNKAETAAQHFQKFLSYNGYANAIVPIVKNIPQYYNNILCAYRIIFADHSSLFVSGTEAATPILIYEPQYDSIIEKPVIYYFLEEQYLKQLYEVIIYNLSSNDSQKKWDKILNENFIYSSASGVPPLLEQTVGKFPVWGQSTTNDGVCDGYNNDITSTSDDCSSCESKKCVVGCVATAMAQIMYYWKHPLLPLYLFDWCHMSDALYSWDQDYVRERNAIANLTHKVATSIATSFCSDGCESGASMSSIPFALSSVFQYSSDADHQNRMWYGYNVWTGRMKNNLDHGWPFIYGGYGNILGSGGHSFVCDGYIDEGTLFHFNFGWYGQNGGSTTNGFYNIEDISPYDYNFNWWQDAVFYIYPNNFSDYCNSTCDLTDFYNDYYSQNPPTLQPYEVTPKTSAHLLSALSSSLENRRTIPTGVTTEYIARKSIILRSGFKAEVGCNFQVKTNSCNFCDQPNNSSHVKDTHVQETFDNISSLMNIENLNSTIVTIHPNPTKGVVNIIFPDVDCYVNIECFDTFGSCFYSSPIKSKESKIDLSNKQNGLYIIKVHISNMTYYSKVILLK